MILGDSKFNGSTFYLNLRVSLLLGRWQSAVKTYNLILLRIWVQLCKDTGETSLRQSIFNKFVLLLGLKYATTGALHNAFLIVAKACSHLSDHVNWAFFMVRAPRGAVLLENSRMKYALKFVIPKNDSTFAVVVGLVALSKAVVQS